MPEDERTAASAEEASIERIRRRIQQRDYTVGVVGLGFVGLPLSLAYCESGFRVLGFDIDPAKVDALSEGNSYIDHLEEDRVRTAVSSGRLTATADFSRLGEPDAILICVPTPLDRHQAPDLRHVESTARQISKSLRFGQLVVLESTTYPGTTEEVLAPILDGSGLACGSEYFLAFSPEREDPGNRQFRTTSVPKVVGAMDRNAATIAVELYSAVFREIVPVSSTRAAEATKLTENIFRSVNIALVNELKKVYSAMDIDIWEVIDAAATKPYGFMRFTPGPGWGGHCIPVDPFYLAWKAREKSYRARFIELAGVVNREMPDYVMERLTEALNQHGKPIQGSSVLILGLAYKPDIADARESPAFELMDRLLTLGARVSYHDPLLPEAPQTTGWPQLPRLRSVALDRDTLAAQDAVVLVTKHSTIDYDLVAATASLIVDTRGVYRQAADNVVQA